jgi:hypothetical protein
MAVEAEVTALGMAEKREPKSPEKEVQTEVVALGPILY